jgi:peptide-methionine (S)-S-oxide reductase
LNPLARGSAAAHPGQSRYYRAVRWYQQYLAKNPNGYCGVGGTGLLCPVGVARTPETAAE